MPGLVSPGRRFIGRGNPQGVVAAPPGSNFIDEVTGANYAKVAGFSNTGWYLIKSASPLALNYHGFLATQNSTATTTQFNTINLSTLAFAFNADIISTYLQPTDRLFSGGYTSTVIGNSTVIRPTISQAGPYLLEGTTAVPDYAKELDVDAVWDIMTTPQRLAASAATDLTNIRLWIGFLSQNATLTTDATLVSSDTLATAFSPSLGVGQGQHGIMFRYSTAAADPGWVVVTCNDNGAAFTQSVSGLVSGGALVANTIYRLRLRYLRSAATPAVMASINDGPETTITANVVPGTNNTQTTRFYVPYVAIQTLAAARKAITISRYWATWGNPVTA